jgi:hypothetical protein
MQTSAPVWWFDVPILHTGAKILEKLCGSDLELGLLEPGRRRREVAVLRQAIVAVVVSRSIKRQVLGSMMIRPNARDQGYRCAQSRAMPNGVVITAWSKLRKVIAK